MTMEHAKHCPDRDDVEMVGVDSWLKGILDEENNIQFC